MAFNEQTGTANPFNGIDVGSSSAPTLADIDRDGDFRNREQKNQLCN
jgi:hypothetical protein